MKRQIELLLRHGEVLDIATEDRKLLDAPSKTATSEQRIAYDKLQNLFTKDIPWQRAKSTRQTAFRLRTEFGSTT